MSPVDTYEVTAEYDPGVWVLVPQDLSESDADAWIAAREVEWRERSGRAEDAQVYRQALRELLKVARGFAEWDEFWAMLPDSSVGAVAVTLDVDVTGVSLSDLVAAAAKSTRSGYETPTVEEVRAEILGEGVRVARFDVDTDGSLFGTVFYFFVDADRAVVFRTQSAEIAVLDWARPWLESLIDGIRVDVVREGGGAVP